MTDPTASASFKGLADIPWCQHLGMPNPRDSEVERIGSFDEWVGPESGYVDRFGQYRAMAKDYLFHANTHLAGTSLMTSRS